MAVKAHSFNKDKVMGTRDDEEMIDTRSGGSSLPQKGSWKAKKSSLAAGAEEAEQQE